MSRIMTVDPSTKLGWSHGKPGERLISGVFVLPAGARMSVKAIAVEQFMTSMIKANGITEVICERPILPKVTSFDSILSMVMVAGMVGVAAAKCGADTYFVDQQTWRKAFMGVTMAPKMRDDEIMAIGVDVRDPEAVRRYKASGGVTSSRKAAARRKWLKKRTMDECRKHGYDFTSDDEADAVAIWLAVQMMRKNKAAAPQLDLMDGMTI